MLFLGLISSDSALCHAIGEQLRDANAWHHATLPSLEAAIDSWRDRLPDLLLWDAQEAPATEEALEYALSRLRLAPQRPFLLVLGRPPEAMEAFGVTEIFTRPLRLGYFLARLHFYQRILAQSPNIALDLGPWVFSPRARTLCARDGSETHRLTEKESALLEFLCTTPKAVPRDELLAEVWGYDAQIDTHTLETHIYRLRRKLMTENSSPLGDVFDAGQGGYQINPSWRTT